MIRVSTLGLVAMAALATSCSRSDRASGASLPKGSSDLGPSAGLSAEAAPSAAMGAVELPLPPDYQRARVAGVAPTTAGHAVLLVVDQDKKALPIFIGGTEALSIQLRIGGRAFHRPLTHDLFDRALERMGGRVHSVRVDKLEDGTFIGSLILESDGRFHQLDARPSDCIALAVGARAPIYVAKSVMDRAGVSLDRLPQVTDPPAEPDEPPGVAL